MWISILTYAPQRFSVFSQTTSTISICVVILSRGYLLMMLSCDGIGHFSSCRCCAVIKVRFISMTLVGSIVGELAKNVTSVIMTWKKLLKYYLPSMDEEIEVILKFEEMCVESTREYSIVFMEILLVLYDNDIVQEEAILGWASEKERADESDKVLLKQAKKFIEWLKTASEEE